MIAIKKCKTYVQFLKELKAVYTKNSEQTYPYLCLFLPYIDVKNPKYLARFRAELNDTLRCYSNREIKLLEDWAWAVGISIAQDTKAIRIAYIDHCIESVRRAGAKKS